MNDISKILGESAYRLGKQGSAEPQEPVSTSEDSQLIPSNYATNFRPIRTAIASDSSEFIQVLLRKRTE